MSYSPNNEVHASHNIPLLDSSLRPANVEFSVSQLYLQSLIVFPLIILTATLLTSSLLYLISHFGKTCLYKSDGHIEELNYRKMLLVRVFLTLLFTAAFIDGFLFLGSLRVTTALNDMELSIAQLIAVGTGVLVSTKNIQRHFSAIVQAAGSSSACAEFTSTYMQSYMTKLSAATESSDSVTTSMLSTLHTLESYFHHPLVVQKDLVVNVQ